MQGSACPERRRLLGFQEDVDAFLAGLDMFWLSSLREGLPNALLEALAHGLPVIATRCGGVAEFMKDEDHALLVEPGSVDSLVEGIARLSWDAELRFRLSKGSQAHVVQRASFERRMARVGSIYDQLLAGV